MAKTLGTPWQKLRHEVPASELEGVDLYWRASNYLSVGQIYLRSNPLMRTDFVDEKTGEVRDFGRPDVKHRLVGHWGTTPGSTSCSVMSTASSPITTRMLSS